jgi:hypothetical protein
MWLGLEKGQPWTAKESEPTVKTPSRKKARRNESDEEPELDVPVEEIDDIEPAVGEPEVISDDEELPVDTNKNEVSKKEKKNPSNDSQVY